MCRLPSLTSPMNVHIAKIHADAIVPHYVHPGDSGMDLYSVEDTVIPAGKTHIVRTGLKIALPEGYEGQVRPKSGLALHHALTIPNTPGTIDNGYRGELRIILHNQGQQDFLVQKHTKIAQLVICPVARATIVEVDRLDETLRGEGGFGSTGLTYKPTAFTVPPKIALAHLPTPIQQLSRLSQQLAGPDLFIKRDDCTGIAVSGNKVRKLEFIAAQAIEQGYQILITCGGVQSNHARATAAVAARLGLKSHLVLRGTADDIPTGNALLDQILGAQMTYVPDADHATLDTMMQDIAAEYARHGQKALVIPLGASNAIGALGYVAAIEEIVAQCKQMQWVPDYLVSATGSGGTLAGLIIGKELFGLSSQIIGINVSDDEAYFHREIDRILQEFRTQYGVELASDHSSYRIISGYVGAGYALSRPEELRFITHIARTEGILLDPTYTGKAMYGLCQEIEKGTFTAGETILFLHTGGIYGIFPKAREFIEWEQTWNASVS
ncbi:dUTP diphosphatase [candidate division KSB3 bacterium]|uniref:Deoxyuridine 5'-triphosphate nucleotidohydrolase n=1 Tax=candidate division KSB3 bacterium TaxID=2044937 RepID=A0A9D5Q7W8_9BACT|nr:dUTP diphosphatase [candidate division KSB3 bacterium]MBD3327314.1 dUTP diphosphatase [candidate division KSB3 bacterium]